MGKYVGNVMDFKGIWKAVGNYTPLPKTRARLLYKWVKETISVAGDMAECGTFRGGSAKLICKTVSHRKTLHIFDTFVGIPVEQRREGEHSAGDFTCSEEDVRSFLSDCPNIKIYKGLVPQTLDAVADLKFSFVNLDMDIYVPTIAALRFFWPRMSDGGIIVMDDISALVPEAMRDFEKEMGIKAIDTSDKEQAIFKK
jgi:O-methyltransferase